jgi:hypothetical protein
MCNSGFTSNIYQDYISIKTLKKSITMKMANIRVAETSESNIRRGVLSKALLAREYLYSIQSNL